MTPDDIIEMARQADREWDCDREASEWVDYFAKLVDDKATAREREAFAAHAVDIARRAVAQEREACAQVLDEMADQMVADMEPSALIAWVRNRATAIRARGVAMTWPFPTTPLPTDPKVPKYNPNNEEDAPW